MRHRRVRLTIAAPLVVGLMLVIVFSTVLISSKQTGNEVISQSILAKPALASLLAE